MKFSHSFAALFVLVPAVLASPLDFNNGVRGAGKPKAPAFPAKGGNNANNKGNAASSAAATAATTAAAAATSASTSNNGGDAQSSLTLLNSVIATGFENDGQDVPTAGQVASLTSSNNFINFCATVNKPLTNGQQITGGSCNPAPMGVIASSSNMPSAKFVFPANGQTISANQDFTIQMAIKNLNTGHFTNPDETFFSAPQQVDGSGDIIGHSHVVIEQLTSLGQTTPLDPTKFAFFKGLNDVASNGVLSADVAGGLPAGSYRMASINSAANHQPALVAIAQHGSLDDAVYFTVSNGGAATGNNNAGATASQASATATATVGAIKGKNTGNNGAQGGFAAGQKKNRAVF